MRWPEASGGGNGGCSCQWVILSVAIEKQGCWPRAASCGPRARFAYEVGSMSKPQATPEPSMEDILASIRKMISEDRLNPRPVPDQIARTSIGERASAPAAAKSAGWEPPKPSGL